MNNVRVLFLSDTHLGFDSPARPRSRRRRRGPDFLSNYHKALAPAFRGEVDMVVHGGDMFFGPNLPAGLVAQAFEPLKRLADRGVHVFVIPGNHERSDIPYPLLTTHPMVHIFSSPRTIAVEHHGQTVAVTGIPFTQKARQNFPLLLAQTRWEEVNADIRLLCLHQAVEGARVRNFRFTTGADVVRCEELPPDFGAILCGHIHRSQVLEQDLEGWPLSTPVFYAGSVERTSFAEQDEQKGFLTLELASDPERGGRLVSWRFNQLETRPMITHDVQVPAHDPMAVKTSLWQALAKMPKDGVVHLRILGQLDERDRLACDTVRKLAPPTMNLNISFKKVS